MDRESKLCRQDYQPKHGGHKFRYYWRPLRLKHSPHSIRQTCRTAGVVIFNISKSRLGELDLRDFSILKSRLAGPTMVVNIQYWKLCQPIENQSESAVAQKLAGGNIASA
jgi:hypothetical protein